MSRTRATKKNSGTAKTNKISQKWHVNRNRKSTHKTSQKSKTQSTQSKSKVVREKNKSVHLKSQTEHKANETVSSKSARGKEPETFQVVKKGRPPKDNSERNHKSKDKSKYKSKDRSKVDNSEKVNVSKEPKKSSKSSISPSIFENQLLSTYRSLDYVPKTESDATKFDSDKLVNAINEIAISRRVNQSPDLFETETNDIKPSIPVEKISIGVQCTEVVSTQNAQVGTDGNTLVSIGVQTSPLPSPFELYASEDSYDDEESFEESASYDSGSYGSSNTCLDDFDMLEDLNENQNQRLSYEEQIHDDERRCYDETVSVISESPPRDQIYINRRFYSPENL